MAAATTPKRPDRREPQSSRTCEAAGTDAALPGWYVVKQGDTLWSIAERHYRPAGATSASTPRTGRRCAVRTASMPCQRVYLPPAPASARLDAQA